MTSRVLAADIGGTNARFAIAEVDSRGIRVRFARVYRTAAHPDFDTALTAFVEELRAQRDDALAPSCAAIAVAGPVAGGEARLLNRDSWTISRRRIESIAGVPARLLNDFEALAHGIAGALPEDWVELQAGVPDAQANVALVGAGTGLGVAALVRDGPARRPVATEAGHMAFAPQDDLQLALWRHLAARHGRVSAERVLSGSGIASIYEFLRLRESGAEPLHDPAAIGARALSEPGGLARRAIDLFVACYGSFAGDVALAFLARGGLYLCGGIASRLKPCFTRGAFVERFNDKGRHRSLTESVPVRLVVNEMLGLAGAARAAGADAAADG